MPNISKINDKQKAILINLILIFITLAISVKIIYQPKQTQTVKLRAEVKKEIERSSLIKEVISAQNEIKRYQSKFCPENDTAWLENKLGQLSENLDISLLQTKPSTSEEALPGLIPLKVEVKFKANYHQLGKLVSQLEKSAEFIEVKKIKMTSPSKEALNNLIRSDEETAGSLPPSRLRSANYKKGAEEPKIEPAELEALLEKSKEAEVILEAGTFYVQ